MKKKENDLRAKPLVLKFTSYILCNGSVALASLPKTDLNDFVSAIFWLSTDDYFNYYLLR